MEKNKVVSLFVVGAMLAALVGCDTQQDIYGGLPETESPTTDEQNTLLPNPNVGQGLPSGAVPWTNSEGKVPEQGEETSGHNPDNSQWTNWNGTAR